MIEEFKEYMKKTPKVTYFPEYDASESIRAIILDGVEIGGKPVAVFAYIGFPELKKGEKCPAIVLAHGGGGHAYSEWVRRWNERGYAAICCDSEGLFPSPEGAGKAGAAEGEPDFFWAKEFAPLGGGYSPAPPRDHLSGVNKPVREQWMFNVISEIFLARNILADDERVDRDKIGLMGVSWGGVASSIAIGYQPFRFAVCVYGSAYLNKGDKVINNIFKDEKIRSVWAAEDLYDGMKTPVLWLASREDNNFSPLCVELSYERTKDNPSALVFPDGFVHSHEAAWSRPEPYDFADSIIR